MAAGRRRKFDEDQLLTAAAQLFQERGFEGVRVPEIVDRLGICRQSLYRLFGDKRGFFLKVLERYIARELQPLLDRLAAPEPPLEGVTGMVAGWRRRSRSAACLITKSAVTHYGDDEVGVILAEQLAILSRALRAAFERARDGGILRADCDPAALAATVLIAAQGVSAVCGLPGSEALIDDAARGVEQLLAAWRAVPPCPTASR